jgi:hypothetical protein
MNVISTDLSLRTADNMPTVTGGAIVAGAATGFDPQGIAGGGACDCDGGGAEELAGIAGTCGGGVTAVFPWKCLQFGFKQSMLEVNCPIYASSAPHAGHFIPTS